MNTKLCGCSDNCNCHDQPLATAPQSVINSAGSNALSCRVGTHGTFFEALIHRLTSSDYPELAKLRARKTSDPSIALLDAWATAGDVLTFYNERFINEGYLRTSTEHRSLSELSSLIGYRPGPGVASSIYLAFTLEKDPKQASEETLIPKGTAVKSVPGDSETPQTFETTEDLIGRPEWNAIQPRQTEPQDIRDGTVGQIDFVTVDGVSTSLVPNDLIVFVFADGKRVKRYVLRVEPNAAFDSSVVWLVRTNLSARQFVDDTRAALSMFRTEIASANGALDFTVELVSNSIAFGNTLISEDGLIQLDTKAEGQISVWQDFVTSVVMTETKVTTVDNVLNLEGFVSNTKTTLGPIIATFLSDQTKLAAVITHLSTAWGDASPGNGGISDDISVMAMKAKGTTAIGTAASGITQVIATWTGVLRATANQLLADLTAIPVPATDTANDRKQFRENYLTAWATFTDQSNGAFESKRDGAAIASYEFDKFEKLVKTNLNSLNTELGGATPSFVTVADAVKDARRTLTPAGWLAATGLSAASVPVPLRVKYQFVITGGGVSDDTVGPIPAQGLFDRLAKDPGGGLQTVANMYEQSDESLDQIVVDAKSENLVSFVPSPQFEKLKTDVKALGTRIQSLSTTTAAGGFAIPVKRRSDECKSLESALSIASSKLTDLLSRVTTLRDARRTDFMVEIEKIASAFGDPAQWGVGDTKAADAKNDLIDPLLSHVRALANATLKAKVDAADPAKSLNRVLEDLTDPARLNFSKYVPSDNTPYESRHRLLLRNLELLQKHVGGFAPIARPDSADVSFPDAAGLADALAGLAPPGQGLPPLSIREMTEVLNSKLSNDRAEIPDLYRQIAGGLSPQLRNDLVAIWRHIHARRVAPRVLAFKRVVPLFGYNAPKKSIIPPPPSPAGGSEVKLEEQLWGDIDKQGSPDPNAPTNWHAAWRDGNEVYLSQPVEGTASGSVIVFRNPPDDDLDRLVRDVKSPVQPGILNLSAAGSLIELAEAEPWHTKPVGTVLDTHGIVLLRKTTALVQSHELDLVEVPITDAVQDGSSKDKELELNGLYPDLTAGRIIAIVGEQFSIDGAMASELATVKYVRHALNDRAGDRVHTRITLDAPLIHKYKRNKVTIFANVVNATHGETVSQVIGSGDASQSFQKMPLAKGPLTYLAAPTPSGVESTLAVRVNDLLWHERDTLLDSCSSDRDYIVLADEAWRSLVQFGDGKIGARVPTGRENVRAEYRVGLGVAGNVKPGAITQIAGNRPLGLKEVTNPLPATGGADPENVDQIRGNAPLAVMALDRLVSVRDYADFARNYAAIEKAVAKRFLLNGQPTVHVTIAGAGDLPIADGSDLLANLKQAYRKLGDPIQVIKVESRDLLLIFLSVRIRLLPDYEWTSVEPEIRGRLYADFSFSRRDLSQNVYLSEVQSSMQSVSGVAYVDVEIFATLSKRDFEEALKKSAGQGSSNNPLEKVFESLRTPSAIPDPRLPVASSHIDGGLIRPAQIAYLSPDVPDSLFLTEIQ